MGEDHYFPERGAVTPMPPTDPVLYRVSFFPTLKLRKTGTDPFCCGERCLAVRGCSSLWIPDQTSHPREVRRWVNLARSLHSHSVETDDL